MSSPLPRRKQPAPTPLYTIQFVDVPASMPHLMDAHPAFYSKMDAFRALANYEFEFGAYGNVHHIREGLVPVEQIILNPIEPDKE